MALLESVLGAGGRELDGRSREYWSWLAVALFLLTTVDVITTTYATYRFGVVGEANPLVRRALIYGPTLLVAVNLVAIVLVTVLFDRVMTLLDRTPEAYARAFSTSIEVWLGALIAAGLLVFANNLTVIFFGQSLI